MREKEASSGWEKDRRNFFEERGLEIGMLERKEENGKNWYGEMEERDREIQRRERRERIEGARYNRWYKEIKGEGIPSYLKKGWGESRWRRVARFRLGGEVRESRYWEEEERKIYRLCGEGDETWEHVWEGCREWEGRRGS